MQKDGKPMLGTPFSDQRWLQTLAEAQPRAANLVTRPAEQQQRSGYFHTLREIFQQPSTWLTTVDQMISASDRLAKLLEGVQSLVLTGSGSSEFAGDCVCAPIQRDLGIVVRVAGGGELLTHGAAMLPPGRPRLLVSLGRSGDSPESMGAVSRVQQSDAEVRHLVITCNRNGALATDLRDRDNVEVIALDERTNDRSLVMTSSFTNLALGARFLGMLNSPERYRDLCGRLTRIADLLLRDHFAALADVGSQGFSRVVFLGSGARLGSARESALKALEMTAGAVATLYDSYLGLRHGPMSFVNQDTLVVAFLSSDPVLRAYESDLLRELDQKKLGRLKVIVGEHIPADVVRHGDSVLECPGLGEVGDDNTPVVHVIVGQLLAFFRCLEEGLQPDSPSKDGVINRVVPGFKLHLSSEKHPMTS